MSVDVLSRQAVATGRITDAMSGGAPRGTPVLRVLDDSDGTPIDHVAVRALGDGHFAVFGDPQRMLPAVATTIRLEVELKGYAPAARTLTFTPAGLARVTRSLDVDGENHDVRVIGNLPRTANLALQPLPVFIRGRVSEAEEPANPIAGASISITAPAALGPVTSNADGYFTIGPAPVAPIVTLSASAPGRETLTTPFRLDFAQPTNRASLPLEPS